ncbi:hypothetical protein [Rhodococcus opacus]|uniref:hypothetical protein n=1 Tax=Rhodococcus opacus TaxID=37919 RepID=UPI0021C9818D|nr:hypothetical protein [Rhodococcus opacus]
MVGKRLQLGCDIGIRRDREYGFAFDAGARGSHSLIVDPVTQLEPAHHAQHEHDDETEHDQRPPADTPGARFAAMLPHVLSSPCPTSSTLTLAV